MARREKPPEPTPGTLLIAAASLWDDNFARTVVLICEHRQEGLFGLVLNRRLKHMLSDARDDFHGFDAPLYKGGPVQENTLHLLHRRADLDIGSVEVMPGVFWGGDFGKLTAWLKFNRPDPDEFRFFVGYSGWGQGQLASEIKRDDWYLTPGEPQTIFAPEPTNLWRATLRTLGPSYRVVATFPDDPRLN